MAAAAPVSPRAMEPEQQSWEMEVSFFSPLVSVRNNNNTKAILLNRILIIDRILKERAVKYGAIVDFKQTIVITKTH